MEEGNKSGGKILAENLNFDLFEDGHEFGSDEKVFLLDQNNFDIFTGIVTKVLEASIKVFYPDFEKDEEIMDTKRILPRSIRNQKIFKFQEEIRKKVAEEEDNECETLLLAGEIIEERIRKIPSDILQDARVSRAVKLTRDALEFLKTQNNSIQKVFVCDLSVAVTRVFEAWKLRDEKKHELDDASLITIMFEEVNILSRATSMFDKLGFQEGNQVIVNAAKAKFEVQGLSWLNDLDLLVSKETLHGFLEQQQVYSFDSSLGLYGLSSVDGSRSYFCRDRSDEETRITVEHESAHNVLRFLSHEGSKARAEMISPFLHSKLKVSNLPIESGEHYQRQFYQGTEDFIRPFCLSGVSFVLK